jgi:plasmid stabilization system protein ParE
MQMDEIIKWYAKQSAQATENFVIGLFETIDRICLDPFRYRNAFKNYREFYWKQYGYYIIFLVYEEEREVIIYSLYHRSRNPKNKYY